MTGKSQSGIYQIRHLESDKRYVGSAVNLVYRWRQHLRELTRNGHHSAHLQRAWNKYGERAFEFSLIEEVPNREDLIVREQFWIDAYQACGAGYNMAPRAGSNLGGKRSPETKAKISAAQKGRKQSPVSEETREKLRLARSKRIETDETKAKRIASLKQRGAPKFTQEQRERSIISRRGAKRTQEQKDRISAALIGKPRSEELREKLRASWARRKADGYKRPESAITKLRATWRKKAALLNGLFGDCR